MKLIQEDIGLICVYIFRNCDKPLFNESQVKAYIIFIELKNILLMNSYFSHSPVKFVLSLRCLVPNCIKIVCCDQCYNWAGSRMNLCHAAPKTMKLASQNHAFSVQKMIKKNFELYLKCWMYPMYPITINGWLQQYELLLRKRLISN